MASLLVHENQAASSGFRLVIGIDEAGRGPLAGPVVASAVLLKKKRFKSKIYDSKQCTRLQRETAFLEIFQKAYVGIGIINEEVIDQVNIYHASHLAMASAVQQLVFQLPKEETESPEFQKQVMLLVDGKAFKSDLPYVHKTIVKGDCLSLSIACASIVAKVYRDRILDAYDKIFPQYGFRRHKGYATRTHRLAIREHGISPIHRKTFVKLKVKKSNV